MHFGTASHCIHLFNMYVNFKSFIDDKLMKNITFMNVCNCIYLVLKAIHILQYLPNNEFLRIRLDKNI